MGISLIWKLGLIQTSKYLLIWLIYVHEKWYEIDSVDNFVNHKPREDSGKIDGRFWNEPFIVGSDYEYVLLICVVSFPHGPFQCVVSSSFLLNNCNYKLSTFVISLPCEFFQYVVSNSFFLNNCNHKLSICAVFSLMNWFNLFFQVSLCWTTMITNWAFVWFLYLINSFNMLLQVAISWTTILSTHKSNTSRALSLHEVLQYVASNYIFF